MALTPVQATVEDVIKAGQAIFGHRKSAAVDNDSARRHPMMFKDYKWDDLPASEKIYYCDMGASALVSFGVSVPEMPVFRVPKGA